MNKQFAQKFISYIEHTNTLIEKYACEVNRLQNATESYSRKDFQEKLAESIDIMANGGIIPSEYASAVFHSLKDDPVKVAEFLTKTNTDSQRIGESSSIPTSGDDVDAILAFSLGLDS